MYAVGDRVGRFEVLRVLGEGATSVVCEVEDGRRRCALKVLGLRSAELKGRMAREGNLVRRLDHPNVVRVLDVLEVDERPAILMELVEGTTLERWLAERPAVELAEAERVARALLDGVEHAHSHGVVHRDLKPANVLLTADGVPKVVDFGLAKGESDHTLTRSGMMLGTPSYAAPEQVSDARRADHRADVFSLGCLLYELFCGRKAFPGKRTVDVLTSAAKGMYEPPDPTLPDGVIRGIRGALEPDPTRRIPDVSTLRRTLFSPPEPARRSRAPVWIAATGVAVVLAAGGLAGGLLLVGVAAAIGLGWP